MQYHEDTGTVMEVTEEKALVRLDHERSKDCGGCCACSALGGAGLPTIEVERDGLEQGDRVEVRIPRVNAYLSMLLVFGLPVALFMAGISVGQLFEGEERLGGTAALGGIIGIIVAFLIAWLVNRTITGGARPEARKLPAES